MTAEGSGGGGGGGILAEIGKVLFENIELIMTLLIPLAALIAYIGRKIDAKIKDVGTDTTKDMGNILKEHEELKVSIKELNDKLHKIELNLRLSINTLETKYDSLKFSNRGGYGNSRDRA